MQYDNEFRFKITSPISPLKSPDISAPVGNSCGKPQKGDSRFFSRQRPNFLDVNTDGENEALTAQDLKRQFIENHKRVSSKRTDFSKKPGASFIITVKNGRITQMTDGNNQKVSHKGYNLNMLGLAGERNGVFNI